MKVKIGQIYKNFKTVSSNGKEIFLIDQRVLPYKFKIHVTRNYFETARAIKDMTVRGAPAIGATAAYGLSQEAALFSGKDLDSFFLHMKKVRCALAKTRPTAYDLFYALDHVEHDLKKARTVSEAKLIAKKSADEYAKRSEMVCKKIGLIGEKLINKNTRILTHCNAGALGCVDYGTALAPIRFAQKNKKHPYVFVDETRPRLQGAKLTSWELLNEGISHAIIADNAAGHFMRLGEIDIVIVGADRIAVNGDFANKIGTYEKAVLAKENAIPFYVAAPFSTIDFSIKDGSEIPIEERSENEVLFVGKERIAPSRATAKNPSFDVTPARYVKGFITERGLIAPKDLKKKSK